MFNSIIFSPVAVAAYVTIIFSLFSPIGLGSMNVLTSIILGILFLTVVPMFAIFSSSKSFTGWEFFDRKKRNKPYFFSLLSYLSGAVVFLYLGNHVMFLISFTYFIVTLTMMIINFFWKISLHTSGIAGPVTSLVYVFGLGIAPLYLLLLPVAYSRYKLNSHDFLQLLVGALLGIFITYSTYFILW